MSLRFSIPITLTSLGRGFHLVPDEEIKLEPSEAPPPIDYAPAVDAGRRVVLWLLGIARSRTSDPIDLVAIDRVQRAATALLNRVPVVHRPEVSEEDLLTVVGLLLTAFEGDLGMVGIASTFAELYDAADGDLATMEQMLSERVAILATSSKPAADRVVPVAVRRRPRFVEDALDDLFIVR